MPIERIDIADDAFESQILEMLENSGFAPHREKDVIHLNGVGIGLGNSSVDIEIDLVAMDDGGAHALAGFDSLECHGFPPRRRRCLSGLCWPLQ